MTLSLALGLLEDPTEPQKQRIREVGEQLDSHRKRQQHLHPDLTMTGMYNVLEKLREIETAQRVGNRGVAGSGGFAHGPGGENVARTGPFAKPTDPATQMLSSKERKIHDDGLVSVLKQIHDDLDDAVFEAYGWPGTLTDEEILERLVALNHERAAEEAAGKIRWLRPEFQCPQTGKPTKTQQSFAEADEDEEDSEDEAPAGKSGKGKKKPAPKPASSKSKAAPKAAWPATLPKRIQAVRQALTTHNKPATAATIAGQFTKANKATVAELLETLVAVGQARVTPGGEYAP